MATTLTSVAQLARFLIENGERTIFLVDVATATIIDANGPACRLLGLSQEELIAAPRNGWRLPLSALTPGSTQPLSLHRADGTLCNLAVKSVEVAIAGQRASGSSSRRSRPLSHGMPRCYMAVRCRP